MSSIAALRLVTARAAPAGRRAMGGGTATRPRPSTEGRAPAFNMCAGLVIFEALRWVDPLASTRTRSETVHAPRRHRRDCRSTVNEPPRAHAPRPPRPAQFDGKPFNKGSMAASVIATVAGGAGVICFAAFFQNKKHGFIK